MSTAAEDALRAGCHFDHHDKSVRGDELYAVYEQLRQEPVRWSEHYGGFWIVSRFDEVRAVLADWQTFSSAEGCFLPDSGFRTAPLDMDPPNHGLYRGLFLPVGGRSVAKANEAKIADLARRIVGEFRARGGGDAIPEISEILPVEAIALMAGLSADIAQRVRAMTVEAMAGMKEDPGALAPLGELLAAEVRARRGGTADDFLTWLANGKLGDRSISDDEAGNVLTTTVIAGHETTMNASGNLMLELAKDPDLQDRLAAEPGRIPRVVEESLRHRAPTHIFFRTVTRDVDVAGTSMRRGDKVAVLYGSANRDDRRFEDPDAFDPDRRNVNHVAFGWGIHRCVGAPLAQLELRLLVVELVRQGRIALVGEPVPKPLEGGLHLGLQSLPLSFRSVER